MCWGTDEHGRWSGSATYLDTISSCVLLRHPQTYILTCSCAQCHVLEAKLAASRTQSGFCMFFSPPLCHLTQSGSAVILPFSLTQLDTVTLFLSSHPTAKAQAQQALCKAQGPGLGFLSLVQGSRPRSLISRAQAFRSQALMQGSWPGPLFSEAQAFQA